METYFLDTNIILRFLLKDHLTQSPQARIHLQQAKTGEIKLILIPEIVVELEYVLRKVYKHDKKQLIQDLNSVISFNAIEVRDRLQLREALQHYRLKNIDFVDAFLLSMATHENARVLYFDKDFKKIK